MRCGWDRSSPLEDEPSRSWLRRSRTGEIRSVPGSGAPAVGAAGREVHGPAGFIHDFGECRNSVVFLRLMPEAA